MTRSKIYEALLVMVTALVVIYLIGWLRHGAPKVFLLYLALGIGISGIVIRPLGKIIALSWYKLADLLGWVMSKILMTIVFVLILVPTALLSRISRKDRLSLGRRSGSMWIKREHRYSSGDLDKLW